MNRGAADVSFGMRTRKLAIRTIVFYVCVTTLIALSFGGRCFMASAQYRRAELRRSDNGTAPTGMAVGEVIERVPRPLARSIGAAMAASFSGAPNGSEVHPREVITCLRAERHAAGLHLKCAVRAA